MKFTNFLSRFLPYVLNRHNNLGWFHSYGLMLRHLDKDTYLKVFPCAFGVQCYIVPSLKDNSPDGHMVHMLDLIEGNCHMWNKLKVM